MCFNCPVLRRRRKYDFTYLVLHLNFLSICQISIGVRLGLGYRNSFVVSGYAIRCFDDKVLVHEYVGFSWNSREIVSFSGKKGCWAARDLRFRWNDTATWRADLFDVLSSKMKGKSNENTLFSRTNGRLDSSAIMKVHLTKKKQQWRLLRGSICSVIFFCRAIICRIFFMGIIISI